MTVLFIGSAVGASVLSWFALPDLLADAGDDAWRILGAYGIVAGLAALLIVPEAYLVVRRLMGIPLLMIDRRGIVAGGSWDSDLAIEWHNVRSIRVRTTRSNGITDHQVIVEPIRPEPIRQRAMGVRQKAVIAVNRLMYGSPIGISTVYVGGGWKAVAEALREHHNGPILVDEG